jgi:hypothetical protein
MVSGPLLGHGPLFQKHWYNSYTEGLWLYGCVCRFRVGRYLSLSRFFCANQMLSLLIILYFSILFHLVCVIRSLISVSNATQTAHGLSFILKCH